MISRGAKHILNLAVRKLTEQTRDPSDVVQGDVLGDLFHARSLRVVRYVKDEEEWRPIVDDKVGVAALDLVDKLIFKVLQLSSRT